VGLCIANFQPAQTGSAKMKLDARTAQPPKHLRSIRKRSAGHYRRHGCGDRRRGFAAVEAFDEPYRKPEESAIRLARNTSSS